MKLALKNQSIVSLYFRVRNRSSSRRLPAVVLIDYIGVNTDPCSLNVHLLPSHSTNMNRSLPSDPTTLLQNYATKRQSEGIFPSTQTKSVDLKTEGKKGLQTIALADKTAKLNSAFPQSLVAVNPFVELFGRDFAEFLDPNFNTSRYELTEQKLSTGDKSDMIPSTSTKRVKVENSHFIEARIQPGQVAVFEKDVDMADTNYNILVDHLEWSQLQSRYTKLGKGGEKLSICCFVENRQPFETHCPFESRSEVTEDRDALNWKSDKLMCPQHTTKLIFICENYGTELSVCALDNIRLHKQADIEFVEPCQKNELIYL
uniref:Uncharacterized protein n=1 Tax=Ditylenchus dipsaci TaxID=166011 RepID=A0A915DFH2_9BILA